MTNWDTFQIAFISPALANDSAYQEGFKPIYERAKAHRAEIIEAALFVESRIDVLLCRLFVGVDDHRVHFFRALILEPESCSFHQKWKMLRGALELRGIPRNCISEEERRILLTQLKQLIAERNKFAHGDIYVDARDSRVFVQYYEGRKREQYLDDRYLSETIGIAHSVHAQLEKLISAFD